MGVPPRLVRAAAFLVAAVLTFVLIRAAFDDEPLPEAPTQAKIDPAVRDLDPYEGLGTWVDAFDYGRAYQTEGHSPAVTPADLDAMAEAGVRTVFLQITREDERSPDGFVDRERAEEFVLAAHERDMAVVGWYLPTFASVNTDLRRLRDLLEFEVDGHRLDGVGVDIEFTEAVPNPAIRSARLVRLTERLDEVAADMPLAAIVLPPVLTEVVNTNYWPEFPWAELKDHYDVWLPMSYWTFRDPSSGYLDPAAYHGESVNRMLANLGVEEGDVPVHGIGGIGDLVTGEQLLTFARTLAEERSIGGSIYDWATLSEANRALLRRLFADYPDIPR